MESNIKLGKLFGIEIGINYSWFIIFFLITFSLWGLFSETHKNWPGYMALVAALVASALFFLSLLAHELSHSLLAIAKGLPVRSITLFVFGGVSRIEKEAMTAGTEFLVGVIGPVSSFVISLLFYGVSRLVDPASPVGAISSWLATINLGLAIFNLIPGFPLDGGRVLRAIIWEVTGSMQKATRVAAAIGQGFAYLFIISGIMVAFGGRYLFGGGDYFINGLWIAFIGWFLLDAARSSQQAMVFERAIKGVHAHDVMSANAMVVAASASLERFFEDYVIKTGRRCFIVEEQGRLLGLITPHELKAAPRQNWAMTTVGQAMRPFETMKWVDPGADLSQVLELMERDDVNQIPVVSNGRLEGLIRREDILRYISTRAEFDY